MILTRFVAKSFETLIEVAMWLVLLIGFLQGINLGDRFFSKLFMGIAGLAVALAIDVVVFGTLVILLEIRGDLKKLVAVSSKQS